MIYALSLIMVAVIASGLTIFIYESNVLENKLNRPLVGTKLEAVDYLYDVIQAGYIEEVDNQTLIDGALKGMTEALDDPYSTYLSGEQAKAFDEDISGSFEGIGAVMTQTNDLPTVAEPPIKGSPAEKAKLQAGDMILKVNGEETKGKSLDEVVKQVRGEKGTSVELEIGRDTETFSVEIVRDMIPMESVKGKIDPTDKHVGYIQLTAFNETTSDEFDEVVKTLRQEGATSFIIDVRGNPGGILTEVEKISSRFLKDGQPIVKFEDRSNEEQVHVASKKLDNGNKIKEPTVLLVDENSASASEIMAGAFAQSAKLDVIGTKTFGKGTVQTLIPLSDTSEVKLTVSKWLTPNGTWIHKEGVEPTILVEKPEYLKNNLIDKSLTYQVGFISDNNKIINQYLQVLGYNATEKSDLYTEETAQGISRFQKEHDLKETGQADKDTLVALEMAIVSYWEANDPQYNKALEVLTK